MKKLIAFLLVLAMLLSFAACGPVNSPDTTSGSTTPSEPSDPPVSSEPPTSAPPVSEPPVTEPPVTEPPVTEPPVTEPPVSEPPVSEPPVSEPPVSEPPVTEPPVTEPPVTEPPVTEPPVTEPPVTEPPVLEGKDEAALRELVVAYMYEICTIEWTPAEDIIFECDHASHKQVYKKGVTYKGLPYTHHCGSLEKFKAYLNDDGTMTEEHDLIKYWGNDCADAVYWAWSQISADISFTVTKEMFNTNGVIPVGNYNFNSTSSTKTICTNNGKNTMFKAYAQLQPGDAVLYGKPSGHIRMVSEAPHIVYNSDGTINGTKSYIRTHEQGANPGLGSGNTTCKVNGLYTFNSLYNGGYVPITIEAFSNGVKDKAEVSTTNTALDKSGVGKGTVSSNYRLNSVWVRISDASGNVVIEKVKYPPNVNTNNGNTYNLSSLGVDISGLTAGKTYTYEVLVGVGGQIVTVQTFKFTA